MFGLDRAVFSDAADLLDREGWCRGVLWSDPPEATKRSNGLDIEPDHPKHRCVIGAIDAVLRRRGIGNELPYIAELYRTVYGTNRVTGTFGRGVANWNDMQGQTQEVVVGVLRDMARPWWSRAWSASWIGALIRG